MAKAYTLFSSSGGNCFYLKDGEDEILIDVGASCKAINDSLRSLGSSLDNIKAIFITHEHSDHIKGLETICKKYNIPVFCTIASARCICAMNVPARTKIKLMEPNSTVSIGSLTVKSAKTPHDSAQSVCFRISLSCGGELGYATDIGTLTEEVVDTLCGCKYVVIESNHDKTMLKNGPYPQGLKARILGQRGHLSNEDCARFLPTLAACGCRSILLAHLSRENNTPKLAYDSAKERLGSAGYTVGEAILLDVAAVNSPVALIEE